MHKTLLLITTTLLLQLTSCTYIQQYIKKHESEGIIASIGDKHLYHEDIKNLIPQGTTSTDSIAIVEAYIQRWATNILILQNAERNIDNQTEINKLVEDYRRTLIIHYYKQEMVNEKIKTPTNEETTIFYNENQNLFLLEQPIVKGALMTIPSNIKSDKIQRKFKDLKNIEDIEKYALQYANDYQLFTEYWKPINEIVNPETSKLKITKPGYYEEKDSLKLTIINITDYIPQGEIAPIEMVMEEVRTALYNQQKMEYLNNLDNEIYDYAIKHNQIKFN